MADPATKLDPYALWRLPNFRRYVGSWFLLTFAKRVELAAFCWALATTYDETQGSFLLGLVGLVRALPVMLLFIAGGHLADRFDRRWVAVLSYSACSLSTVGMLAVVALGESDVWIFALLALGAAGATLGFPSRQAMLPHLVPSKLFSHAVAWNSSAFYVASVSGPIIAGLVYYQFAGQGLLWAFALVLVCRVLAVGAFALLPSHRADHEEQAASWENLVAGIRFVWRTKLILAAITLDMFAVLLGGAVYLLPVFAEHVLHVGPAGFGLLSAADMVGAIGMLLFLAHRPPLKRPGVALLWAVAGFGAATVIFGLSRSFWLSFAMMFLVGAFDNISVVVRHTLVQMLTPDKMRGRVSAVNGVFIVASNDLGGLESGLTSGLFGRWFGAANGPVLSVVVGGIGAILVVLGVRNRWPQILKIKPLDKIEPVSPTETDREA